MGVFTVTTEGKPEVKPTVNGMFIYLENRGWTNVSVRLDNGANFQPVTDTPDKVKFPSLSPIGTFTFNDGTGPVPVIAGQEYFLNAGTFMYESPDTDNASTANSTYAMRGTNSGLWTDPKNINFITDALIIIKNYPATVGDNTINIDNNTVKQLSIADFTTGTTPPYSDPENDAPKNIKFTLLPASGTLSVNGVAVTLNQVFLISDIVSIEYAAANAPQGYEDDIQFAIEDTGSGEYSNNGNIKLVVKEATQYAPTVDSFTENWTTNTHVYTQANFTHNFLDQNGDGPLKVKIVTVPSIGKLTYVGGVFSSSPQVSTSVATSIVTNVYPGMIIDLNNISLMRYTLPGHYLVHNGVIYQNASGSTKSFTDIVEDAEGTGYHYEGLFTTAENGTHLLFTGIDDQIEVVVKLVPVPHISMICLDFKVSDDSFAELYSNLASMCLKPVGDFNVPLLNSPPTIGDNTITVYYDSERVFTRQDFVEDTNPAFLDPEGDQPHKLKVMSLPEVGQLLLRGVPVEINDEMFFVDDIEAGEFKYVANETSINSVNFEFQVSDTGSKQFVG